MYVDIITPISNGDMVEAIEKALSLGYSRVGVVGDFRELPPEAFSVAILSASDIPLRARRIRGRYDILIARPRSLEEARKFTATRLVDAVLAACDSGRPNFDYVCARQLKRNEGALIIPVSHLMRTARRDPRVLRNVRLELEIAMKAGVYPVIASFASRAAEVAPPRLLISFAEFFFDLSRSQAKMFVKDFPAYLTSPDRRIKLRGAASCEV